MRKKRAEHANWLMTTRQFCLEVCKAKCRTAQWQPGHKGGGDRGRAVWQTKASSDPQQQQHKTHTSSHNEKGIKMRSVPELSWVRRCFRPHTTWRTLVLSTSLSLSPSPSPSPYLFFLCALAVRCHSSAWIINRFFDANRWENLSYLIDRKIAATRLTQHRQHSSNCWERKRDREREGELELSSTYVWITLIGQHTYWRRTTWEFAVCIIEKGAEWKGKCACGRSISNLWFSFGLLSYYKGNCLHFYKLLFIQVCKG